MKLYKNIQRGVYLILFTSSLFATLKKINNSWSEWITLKTYTFTSSELDGIDITNQLPCDSIQIRFFYSDSSSNFHWGYGCGIDNIYLICSYINQHNFGSMKTVPILYSELSKTFTKNSWRDIIVYRSHPLDSLGGQVEYFNGSNWLLIPDYLLPNNSIGIYKDTISLFNIDTITFGEIRIKVLFFRNQNKTP